MTTSDRAGNEERREDAISAALEHAGGYLGYRHSRIGAFLGALHEQGFDVTAALAATPTQSGAEGPLSLREAVQKLPFLDVNMEDGGGGRMVALDAVLAALRSGAEVAAAPGLDVAVLAQALAAADGLGDTDWTTTPAQLEWANRIAAEYDRLTDNPS